MIFRNSTIPKWSHQWGSHMSLFSWFKRTEKMAPQGRSGQNNLYKLDAKHQSKMWPIAHVRPCSNFIYKQPKESRHRPKMTKLKINNC